MIEAREFWDGIATSYLHAWATDYETPAARALTSDRNELLTFLVQTKGVEIPDGNTRAEQEKQLQKCFRKRFGKKATLPSIEHEEGDEEEDEMPAEQQRGGGATPPLNQEDMGVAANTSGEDPHGFFASARPPQHQPPHSQHTAPVAPHEQALAERYAALLGQTAPAPGATRVCLVCGVPPPSTAPPIFNCGGCGLRGDITISHPANEFLRARLLGPTNPAAAAGAVASSSSGQSSNSVIKPLLSALDQSFVRMLERGVTVPLFSGPTAGEVIPYTEALQLTARAFEATRYQPPSEHLIALVRAGKLRDIGYALPRPHQSLAGALESESSTVALSGGTIQFLNKVPVAPAVSSSQQFCMALLSLILPALIDRPRAMMEWITLGHTALALEASNSWTTASLYVQRTLASAIEAGKPFAEDINTAVLLPIVLASSSHARGAAPAAVARNTNSGGAGAADRSQSKACYNWNAGKQCSREPCGFAHVCQYCASADHRGPACPSAPAGSAPPRRASAGSSSVASRSTARRPHAPAAGSAAAAQSP